MHWIMRACVAPDAASLPQDAGVAQDGAAVLAVTHAAQAGAAVAGGAQPVARRAAPAGARPGAAVAVHYVRPAASAHAWLVRQRAAPVRDGCLRRPACSLSRAGVLPVERVPSFECVLLVGRALPAARFLSGERGLRAEHFPSFVRGLSVAHAPAAEHFRSAARAPAVRHFPSARRVLPQAVHAGAAVPRSACPDARRSRPRR